MYICRYVCRYVHIFINIQMIRHLERLILTAPSNIIQSLATPRSPSNRLSPKSSSRSSSSTNHSSINIDYPLTASPFVSTDNAGVTTGIIYVYIYVFVYRFTYMNIDIYMYRYMYINIYIYIYIYKYTCIYS
jgi:hypothetical protein